MSRLSEDFQDQLSNGQYILEMKAEYVKDTASKEMQKLTTTYVRKDKAGNPVRNPSDVHQYGIMLVSASIDEVDYEAIVDEKLAQKIEQSTKESISKQSLITAQQEALTAKAQGEKLIAETRAREEAAKLEAVIQAQRAKEVEKENAEKALYTAKRITAEKEAEAAANRLLVQAG